MMSMLIRNKKFITLIIILQTKILGNDEKLNKTFYSYMYSAYVLRLYNPHFSLFLSFSKKTNSSELVKNQQKRHNKENYDCKLRHDCHHLDIRCKYVFLYRNSSFFNKKIVFFCLRLIFTNDFYLLSFNGNSVSFLNLQKIVEII